MFTTPITKLQAACLHHIGSNANNEGVVLSTSPLLLDDVTIHSLMLYSFSSFKNEEFYNFYNDLGLSYNEIYGCVKAIFEDPQALLKLSGSIALFLYENSNHPNIKPGELIVSYFTDCEVDGIITDAIGLFKSEGGTDFLSLQYGEKATITTLSGQDLKKVDKAALIFNVNKDNGYAVSVIDNVNKGFEAKYWIEDFLHVRQMSNDYLQTKAVLAAAKDFITKQLPQELDITKAEQATLLNRSVDYFKNNDSFELASFSDTVLEDKNVGSSFNQYLETYLEKHEIESSDSFQISESAVRKQARSIRSVIKLDKNFHIYVHGGERLIKRGYDEETGMPYYKLYFQEEY